MPRLLVAIGQRATSPPRLLRDLVCVLVSPLGDHSRVFIHYAIRPAGAEANIFPIVFILIINLVSMVLAGMAAGVGGAPLAMPDAIDFKEIIAPGHILGGFLNCYRIGDHVIPLSD